MSDYDGLRICEICGDQYTRSKRCSSCERQRVIDHAEGAQALRAVLEPFICEICGSIAHETQPDSHGRTWLKCDVCGHESWLSLW